VREVGLGRGVRPGAGALRVDGLGVRPPPAL